MNYQTQLGFLEDAFGRDDFGEYLRGHILSHFDPINIEYSQRGNADTPDHYYVRYDSLVAYIFGVNFEPIANMNFEDLLDYMDLVKPERHYGREAYRYVRAIEKNLRLFHLLGLIPELDVVEKYEKLTGDSLFVPDIDLFVLRDDYDNVQTNSGFNPFYHLANRNKHLIPGYETFREGWDIIRIEPDNYQDIAGVFRDLKPQVAEIKEELRVQYESKKKAA